LREKRCIRISKDSEEIINDLEKNIKISDLKKDLRGANTKDQLMKLTVFKQIYEIQRNKQLINYEIKHTLEINDEFYSDETKEKIKKAKSKLIECWNNTIFIVKDSQNTNDPNLKDKNNESEKKYNEYIEDIYQINIKYDSDLFKDEKTAK
jgi:hypothetical protein